MNNLFSNPIVIVILLAILFVVAFLYLLSRRNGRQSTGQDKFEELFLRIKEEIKSAVAPKFMTVAIEANEITDLAIEIWRVEQRISESASSLPENQLKGLENSVQKMKRYLEKYDIEVIDYKNHKYNDGLNLDILAVEKDPSVLEPTVKKTVEPTVMLKGQVIRKAKIILLTNH